MSTHTTSPGKSGHMDSQRTARPQRSWILGLVFAAITVVLLATTALADSSAPDAAKAPAVSTPPPSAVYVSFAENGSVPNVGAIRNEDIVVYDPTLNTYSLFFDGSDVGLRAVDVWDFEVLSNGHILFTLNKAFNVPGLGRVDDSDIIEFTPTSTGANTAGTFSIYKKGSDVGLTTGGENIDALDIASDGRIIVSTIGSGSVPKTGGGTLEFKDEDLIILNADNTWELLFDGSDVELTKSSEDIRSLSYSGNGSDNTNLYLTTLGNFTAVSDNTLSGDEEEIFGCYPTSLGDSTSCLFFDFQEFNHEIDGISLVFTNNSVAVTSAGVQTSADEAADLSVDDDTDAINEALSENDPEITVEDFVTVNQKMFMPYLGR